MTLHKLGARGESMVIDLAFAVLIFLLVAGSITWVWSSKATESERRIYEDEMLLMAERALDTLMRNSGQPANWESPTVSIEDINIIGLAKRNSVLDEEKINKLLKLTEEYQHISELAGYWKFDDNPTDNVLDSSKYANNGTCISCPSQTTDREGNANKAYLFDGTSQYIEAADNGNLSFGTGSFTVSMWLKSNGILTGSDSFRLLFKAEGSLASNAGWSFYVQGSDAEGKNGRVEFSNGTNSVTGSPTLGNSFVDGTWHHFVAVVDRSYDIITIYNDSVQQTGTIGISTVSGSVSNNAALTISRNPINNTQHFDGEIDEVVILRKALTKSEVQDLYQDGIVLGEYEKTKQLLLIGANDYCFRLIDSSTGEKVKNSEGQVIEIGQQPEDNLLQVTVRKPVVFSYKRAGEDQAAQHEAIAELTLFSVHSLGSPVSIIPTIESNCDNGIDDDRDSLQDCEDPDCFAEPHCGIAYYKFDDDPTDGVLDSSGNGNHGTIMPVDSEPTWQTTGCKSGNCLNFDGNNDYVSLPWDLLDGKSIITLLAWFKTSQPTGSIITQYDNGGYYAYYLNVKNGKVEGCVSTASYAECYQSWAPLVQDTASVSDNIWHQAALVYNSSEVILYVDGQEKDRASKTGVLPSGWYLHSIGVQGYQIGGLPYPQRAGHFTGSIDEVKIYSRVLTETEICSLCKEYGPCGC